MQHDVSPTYSNLMNYRNGFDWLSDCSTSLQIQFQHVHPDISGITTLTAAGGVFKLHALEFWTVENGNKIYKNQI